VDVVASTLRPYARIATVYDRAFGIPFFLGTRLAFERLVRHYGIRFRSAADLGCGTGLFARYLSCRWGVPVFAVDRSPEMLLEATRCCAHCDVDLLCQDLRQLHLPCPIDLAAANFDTLNHLLTRADLCLALRRVAQNLRPGGHFIFDFVTDCQPASKRGGGARRRLAGGMQQHVRWDPRRRLLSIFVSILTRSGSRLIERHTERAYSPAEMAQCLFRAGFRIRGVHEASRLGFATHCARRVVVVAQRTE
jgi:SAM-dependent methyltransferase